LRTPDQRLSKEPTGTTGCAPASSPPPLTGGAEKAVRICGAGLLGGASSVTPDLAALAVRCVAGSGALAAASFGDAGAVSAALL
jgi:hypothetical protein